MLAYSLWNNGGHVLNLNFSKDFSSSIEQSVIYILSHSTASLEKIADSFTHTSAEFKLLDLSSIPSITDSKDILLVDKKLYANLDPIQLETVLSKKFHLFSFSEGAFLGDSKNLNKFLSGHLIIPFKNVDIKNLMQVTSMKNSHDKKIHNMEKVSTLGNYTGSLIHDLNNFNSICMFSLDAIRLVNEEKYRDEKLALLADRGLRGSNFIKDLANKYRYLLRGESHYKIEKLCMRDIIDKALEALNHLFNSYAIEIRGLSQIERSMSVLADELVFTQVILNLVKNAIEAIKDKEHKWIKFKLKEINGEMVLIIIDSGEGLDSPTKDSVFKRGEESRFDGTGFGLSFCDLELQKMQMELIYLEARNTTFGIKIPKKLYF